MILLSETKGKSAIKRFKDFLKTNAAQLNKRGKTDEGILNANKGFFDWIDQLAVTYGNRIAGSAIEGAQDYVEFRDFWLYYDSEKRDDDQNDRIDQFLTTVSDLIEESEEEAERLAEEVQKKAEEKAEREALYRKERKKLQRLVRSAVKKGIKTVKVPKIPKKITEGSIRRISRLIESVKSKTPARRSGKKK